MRLQQLSVIFLLCLGLFSAAVLLAQSSSEPTQETEEAQEITVNINTADAPALAESLNGVGLARARAIVEWRDANGPFEDAYDLVQVRGISERIVSMNEQRIRVSDMAEAAGN